MSVSGSSHVQAARRVLADRLREMCKDAGLDGKQLAALCGWHPSKVSRIAGAKTSPSADDLHAWCRACGREDQVADLVASLRAVESMWVEWRRVGRAGSRGSQLTLFSGMLPSISVTPREWPTMGKHGGGSGESGVKKQSPKESDGRWTMPVTNPPNR
ncbi:helix-turn-helix domain-containing protein [Kitasatospora sp. NPDC094011]|uniref:helix-turn-helix domain-containing protein n=1 Tax=Kitasatospora sp. NPDC094011 TaxID=3364090 RepID=UPI0038050BE6